MGTLFRNKEINVSLSVYLLILYVRFITIQVNGEFPIDFKAMSSGVFLLGFAILVFAFQKKNALLLVLAVLVLLPSLLTPLRMFAPGSPVWLTLAQAVYFLASLHLVLAALFMDGGLARRLWTRRARRGD